MYIYIYIYTHTHTHTHTHIYIYIARARLRTRLKHWRRSKKSTPCLINKSSRRVADRTSKTATFLIFQFL